MKEDEHEREELLTAAAICGPRSKEPPYVRLPFPMVALPEVLRRFVEEAARAMGFPPECVAAPAIATCATAIGNTCRVRLTPTWTEPSVLWAVTLMESGSLKTPAYNAAVAPLRAAQRLAEEQLTHEQAQYKLAKQQYEAEASYWKAQATQNGQPGNAIEPVEPKATDYFTSDSTVEALATLFANNPRGLALTRDELSGFFSSFGAYKGGRGGDEAAYLEFYNAGAVKINRASGKRVYVHAAALSIFGTCQPSVFARAIGVGGRASDQVENGLAARFVLTSPESKPKRWRKLQAYEAREYHKLVARLLAIPLATDADGRVEPAIVTLTPEAEEHFSGFVDEHGKHTASISIPALRYHYSKLEGVAARLALIFYLCDVASERHVGQPGVQEKHVLGGIALARWFGREAFRVYDGYESAADREKKELLDEIRDHGGSIGLTELRRIRRRWNDPLAAEMALRALARSGWGKLEMVSPSSTGGRPTLRFVLHAVPRDGILTPENTEFPEVSMHDEPTSPQFDV